MLSNFVISGRFREIYNMFWVYPLWWNRKTASFLLNKLFPKLGIDLFPPFLEIEPTTVCDMKCVCCEHTYWKEPSKNMTFEQFKKIFDDFGKPKWLGLTGIGSSYLNKDYHKMLAYAKSKGTIVEVFDHFAHFKNEDEIKELINIGPDFQFISTYGASKNSFEKVCVGSDYTKIEKNLRTFVKLKKQMKKKFPILNFHYIITKNSKEEVLDFLDFIHSLDTEIGEVLITPMLHGFKEAKKYEVDIDG
jgi:MoaA/NifB/PqqE/SkfB family radical SAM enzyme